VARKLSYPSWKVIVSASGGQYLKPGSIEPGFFSANQLPCEPAFFCEPVHFCTIERSSDPAHPPSRIGDHDLVDRAFRRQTVGAAVEIK
jgi:hypothetical protein